LTARAADPTWAAMTAPKTPQGPLQKPETRQAEREARLAKALRDNLRRRKAAVQDAPKTEE
jgi:hypothetical protein